MLHSRFLPLVVLVLKTVVSIELLVVLLGKVYGKFHLLIPATHHCPIEMSQCLNHELFAKGLWVKWKYADFTKVVFLRWELPLKLVEERFKVADAPNVEFHHHVSQNRCWTERGAENIADAT